VKHHGARPSDPFQVRVVTQGPAANLADVGYGVSQALPILVEVLKGVKNEQFILQQPEVHLHPRAQAALGSFFVNAVASQKKRFVIETHSDYLIDRIRLEVASGKLKPEDVQILFFDRPTFDVKIWELGLDAGGNILGAPPSYRSFFLNEEMNLMSRGG
jgi:predicted ATPase